MKKLVLSVFAVCAFAFTSNAQEGFNVGASVGLPMGDAGDFASFNITLDANYLFEVSDKFDAGIATGFNHSIAKEDWFDDMQFIPVAGAARFMATEKVMLGADLGYALGMNEGNDGGFYYRPMAGYNVSEKLQVNLSYIGVAIENVSWNTINLGASFNIN
ncbi:MAG: outer membrane beta-barrel protein [Flavobacteriaceae bacterium]